MKFINTDFIEINNKYVHVNYTINITLDPVIELIGNIFGNKYLKKTL